jgi:hypothetical protein
MTIVLQHRFWDLSVTEDRFEVKLTFDGIPERLVVPFVAIKVFFDPSVRFGLQFEDPNAGPEGRSQSGNAAFDAMSSRTGATRTTHTRKTPRTARKSQTQDEAASGKSPQPGSEEAAPPSIDTTTAANGAPPTPTPIPTKANSKRQESADAAPAVDEDDTSTKSGGAEIVSLDKFRKK